MTALEKTEAELAAAVLAEIKSNPPKPRPVPASLSDQHAAILRAQAELRRRITEERIRLTNDYERRAMELHEQHRRDLAALRDDHEERLRENELLAEKVMG